MKQLQLLFTEGRPLARHGAGLEAVLLYDLHGLYCEVSYSKAGGALLRTQVCLFSDADLEAYTTAIDLKELVEPGP